MKKKEVMRQMAIGWGMTLDRMVREGLSAEVTFRQTP